MGGEAVGGNENEQKRKRRRKNERKTRRAGEEGRTGAGGVRHIPTLVLVYTAQNTKRIYIPRFPVGVCCRSCPVEELRK